MQERKILMQNKTKSVFLTIAILSTMVLGACKSNYLPDVVSNSESNSVVSSDISDQESNSFFNPSSNHSSNTINSSFDESSSSLVSTSSELSSSNPISSEPSSSSSSVVEIKHTVIFMVDGVAVQTSEVVDGELAVFEGEEPTKAGDANASRYKFMGWDRDLSLPITSNTTINAVFSAYYDEVAIDDFESYDDTASMIDEGWAALGYTSSGWTEETKAAVSLGTNAADGNKSLRFDAWQNGVGYKAVKVFRDKEFTQPANALAFKIMVPSTVEIKVLLHATVTIQGQLMAPSFTYTIGKPISGEYVDYVVPLADDGWALWGEAGKSIKSVVEWTGIDEDDILSYLTKIEFYFAGNDNLGGQPYIGFVDSVKFVTLDNPANTVQDHVELFSSYTGTLDNEDKNILRVDVKDDGTATASIIDLEDPQTVNGSIALEGREVTFTSSDNGATLQYKGKITNGGKLIKYISASGTLANPALDMDLTAVQLLDNFEQYDKDGTAYYQNQTNINARSGCRGAYYAEYYSGSGTTEWGGPGWSLLGGEGDQLKLKSDGLGHDGSSNYLCLKNSQWNAIRYMQWGLFDGTSEQNSFRGSKLSFWARTNGLVPAFKVACYSQTTPRNATKDSYVKAETFNCSAPIAEWTHFEVELNPNYVYYGFLVFMEKNNNADSYLYIDDVEVCGANPYAHYEVPAPVVLPSILPGTTYHTAISGVVNTHLSFEANNVAYLFFGGYMFDGEGTYEINDREVTCNFNEGEVIYTATMSDDATELIYKSVSGTETQYVDALENTNFTIMDYLETAEAYDSDGVMYYQGNMNESTASGARGAYYCDYQAGNTSYTSPLGGSGWILMGGSGDQLKLNTTSAYYGNKTLQMKKSSAGAMRYIQWDLYKGTAKPHTNKDMFSIVLNNNCDSETKVRVMVFTEQHLTRENFESSYIYKDITMSANLMIQAEIPLSLNDTYYGYGIMFEKDTKAAYIDVDNAMFSCSYLNEVNYSAPKGLVLHGEGALSDVTIKFDTFGIVLVTFPSLGLNEKACPYSTRFNYNDQEMIIIINGYQIKGNFLADLEGNVSLMITSVASELSTYLDAGNVFNNQPQP